jgi:type II secretory pathway component GspD/PulD (secretin)
MFMNKRVIFFVAWIALFFSVPPVFGVSMDFRGANVVEVVQVLVSGVLKRNYVLAPDLLDYDKKVTVSVKDVELDKLMPVVVGVLRTMGVRVEERDDVLYIELDKGGAPEARSGGFAGADRQSLMDSIGGRQREVLGGALSFPGVSAEKPVIEAVESYRTRGRSVEFLASVVESVGVKIIGPRGAGEILVYGGSAEDVAKAKKLLAQVDLPPASVTVRAVLVEFTDSNTETRSLNVALTALADRLGLVFSAGGTLSNQLTWRSRGLNAVLSAIDGDSRFRYIAEPMIKVIDGQKAKFMVGSEQPTRGVLSSDDSGNYHQSIDYRSAGVQIDLEPRIFADHVQMQVSQQMSSFSLTTTSNIDSPTILKREASTTVLIKPGEVVVLAGMDEKRDSSSSSGLFFLPDFMKGTNSEVSRSQLVLMLEVTLDKDLLETQAQEASGKLEEGVVVEPQGADNVEKNQSGQGELLVGFR